MAKKRGPSIHSRAARRAVPLGVKIDNDVHPPRASAARPSVLAVHQSAGVQKKAKTGRKSQMSTKARRRHEKGLEMASAVIERTSRKLEKSLGRGRAVKQRSKNWEDINKAAEVADKVEGEVEGGDEAGNNGWETDEDMGAEPTETSAAPAPATEAVSVPLAADDDGDEIL